MKLTDLAKQLDLTSKELRAKLDELGFGVKSTVKTVDDEVAELVVAVESVAASTEDMDVAEVYDELIHQEREKEIVKSQRKKMAGKEDKKKTRKEEVVHATPRIASDISGAVEIPDVISVKELAEKTGISVAKIIGVLMKNGILANINQQIDFETVLIVSADLGIQVKKRHGSASAGEILERDISKLLKEEDESVLKIRPPVVVVMGHVDHGKTKLLDAIRETHVVEGESGGITQHIGAYQVEKRGRLITFLDTPGHEAFTEMRARGAKVTDIAILVVAADEGIKPQTIEAINHAREAKVPIIVAINKIDKPAANVDRVKGELSEQGLQPDDWGGKTITVQISALKKEGIDNLLDMILLVADMEPLKANPDREAIATVIEADLDNRLGPVATVLVNTGTLKLGDNFIVGSTFGRVKVMLDSSGKRIQKALPSAPVKIAGLEITPLSGDILQVMHDEKAVKHKSKEIDTLLSTQKSSTSSALNQLISSVQSNKLLKIVLKADMKGSLEAIKGALAKIKDEDVALKIIHSGVGAINESDVMMASASQGFVVGFHVVFDSPHVKETADREGVEVRSYKIIYELIDDVKKLLSGLLEPDTVVLELGKLEVAKIFLTKKKEMIVGCKVKEGRVPKSAKLRVVRDKAVIEQDAHLLSLQRGENAVNEVVEGEECGIKYSGKIRLQEGDIFEAYVVEKKHRALGEVRNVVEDKAGTKNETGDGDDKAKIA
ncbi:MAG: translation initiation factor IF-2 [Candidatus Gracilibacteria bacterium]